MQRYTIYLGMLLVTGLFLAGCSVVPKNQESILTEEENQNIQIDMKNDLTEDGQGTTQAPAESPSTDTNSVDLPSLESDLGSLTLEEERFE